MTILIQSSLWKEEIQVKRILLFVSLIILLTIGWSFFSEKENGERAATIIHNLTVDLQAFINNGKLEEIVAGFIDQAQLFFHQFEEHNDFSSEQDIVEKPQLITPTNQSFSIHNIEIGDEKSTVEENLGEPKRISYNEYGLNWYSYHESYHNYVQVMYNDRNQVVGLFTNQDMISSTNKVKFGSTKNIVRSELGEPTTRIQKGFVFYQLEVDSNYDMFQLDDCYITVFYDIHENNTVTAIQVIQADLEEGKKEFYAKASKQLKEGFEFQIFDLTNATRVQHGLNSLVWDERAQETAQNHSMDMAENAYFDHTNLNGESPFDRMSKDQISYSVAGENLAYGQFSSIFAHEGLMNSLGHRKNILQADFDYLGVGVAFNKEFHPYYTQNYYSK